MSEQRELEWYERYKLQGEARMLHHLLERRFGALPEWVGKQLATVSERQLFHYGQRTLDTKLSLEQLLRT